MEPIHFWNINLCKTVWVLILMDRSITLNVKTQNKNTSSGLLFYKWGAPKETSYKQNLIHYHQKMERSRQMCLINGMIATKWGTHKTYELEYVSMGLGIPPFWNSIQYEYQWWYIKISVSDLIKHGEPQKTHNPSPSKYRFPNSSTYQPFFSNPKCRASGIGWLSS